MFDNLSQKLTKTFRNIIGKGKLSDRNMEDTLQEIRTAFLDADVNYQVTEDFLIKVKNEALGQDVLNSVEPGQMLVKIVSDELIKLLGTNNEEIKLKDNGLNIIMMVGLQGTGKTTQIVKIANLLKKQNHKPLIAACDLVRNAAIEQLETYASSVQIDVFKDLNSHSAVDVALNALTYAKNNSYDVLLIDTAGRLQIDKDLMQELVDIKNKLNVDEILLTVDALTGQDIVNVTNEFNKQLNITGIVVTKYDSDAKGGAILSAKACTGVPIKYVGVGEKVNDIDIFYPDRVANRILGMGDVVSLVEKAQEEMDVKKAEEVASRMLDGKFTLDDMLFQLDQTRKLGPLSSIMGMLPGMSDFKGMISDDDADKTFKKNKSIIQSMTKAEKEDPSILRNSHKRRIASGSGNSVDDVNKLINQFEKAKKMMKQLSSMKGLFGK